VTRTPTVEIVQLPGLALVGYEIEVAAGQEPGPAEIPAFWDRFLQEGLDRCLPPSSHPGVFVAACHSDTATTFRYLVGVPVAPGTPAGDGQCALDIPAGRHARVTVRGDLPVAIPAGLRWFRREWLPASGERLLPAPWLEWYDHRSEGCELAEADLFVPLEDVIP